MHPNYAEVGHRGTCHGDEIFGLADGRRGKAAHRRHRYLCRTTAGTQYVQKLPDGLRTLSGNDAKQSASCGGPAAPRMSFAGDLFEPGDRSAFELLFEGAPGERVI